MPRERRGVLVIVPLTEEIRAQAARVGSDRQNFHAERGTHDAYGLDPARGLAVNVLGALGEIVMASAFGVLDRWVEVSDDWRTLTEDIPGGLQVRTTDNARGPLILHPRDKDDAIFGLVRVHTFTAEIVGFIFGRDGKRAEYWPGRVPSRPCFMVPDAALIKIRVLISGRNLRRI